ncbi:hypothetical protein TEQG_04691 [Trichophyton equinum CBS 127.97]|uniref:Uncharacterized protein n=1 Tax=Trichophyton equinum (strain ATCC MYA-4606 / CBS 127.97) TaxID=559882 RepID=F2PUW5_TRIEC|nr:hypothetical protein TEQG_04691 [Trichophyton equinum CBS 127.97]
MCRICFPLSPHFPGLHGTRFKSALWRFNYSFFLFGWGAWYFCRLDFGTRFTQRRTWCNQKCQVEASFGSAFRDLTPTKAMQVSSRVPPWHSSAALGTAPEALFHVCIQLLTPYSAIAYTEELATFLAFHCAARQKTPEVIGVSENCHLAGCGRQIM